MISNTSTYNTVLGTLTLKYGIVICIAILQDHLKCNTHATKTWNIKLRICPSSSSHSNSFLFFLNDEVFPCYMSFPPKSTLLWIEIKEKEEKRVSKSTITTHATNDNKNTNDNKQLIVQYINSFEDILKTLSNWTDNSNLVVTNYLRYKFNKDKFLIKLHARIWFWSN